MDDGMQQYADAMRAFDAYYGTRRTAHGIDWPKKKYAEHRSWRVFMKVADKCAKAGRDVERFVTTVVERSPKNSDLLTPNDLLTARAEKIWNEHANDQRVGAYGKWKYFVNLIIQIQTTTGQSDEAILGTALNAQFPAWFRIIYPVPLNDEIVKAWGEEALEDLRNDRGLVRFLRAAMPNRMEAFERKMGVIDGL